MSATINASMDVAAHAAQLARLQRAHAALALQTMRLGAVAARVQGCRGRVPHGAGSWTGPASGMYGGALGELRRAIETAREHVDAAAGASRRATEALGQRVG